MIWWPLIPNFQSSFSNFICYQWWRLVNWEIYRSMEHSIDYCLLILQKNTYNWKRTKKNKAKCATKQINFLNPKVNSGEFFYFWFLWLSRARTSWNFNPTTSGDIFRFIYNFLFRISWLFVQHWMRFIYVRAAYRWNQLGGNRSDKNLRNMIRT